jgi:hypothetical protein
MSDDLPAVVIAGVRHLTLKTAAQYVGRNRQWLRQRLDQPGGPLWRYVGGRVMLPEAEYLVWLQGDLRNPKQPVHRSGAGVFRG